MTVGKINGLKTTNEAPRQNKLCYIILKLHFGETDRLISIQAVNLPVVWKCQQIRVLNTGEKHSLICQVFIKCIINSTHFEIKLIIDKYLKILHSKINFEEMRKVKIRITV